MNNWVIIGWIWAAFIAMSFWESSVEGRKAWDKGKCGWKIFFAPCLSLTTYHFWLAWIMLPMLLLLPLLISGWDLKLFGILISAYASGLVIEDFGWYFVNPKVKFHELFTKFSDYYPWIRFGKIKIIPVGYIVGIIIALVSWWFLWR